MTKFLLACASLAIAGAAFAQTEQPRTRQDQAQVEDGDESSQAGQDQGQEKQERLICRRVGMAATGSSMGHRRCLTAAQWRALNRR